MLKIKCCSFDATGTLFRPRSSIGTIYYQAALNFGIPVQQNQIGKLDAAFANAYFRFSRELPNFGYAANISSKEWWNRVVNATFREAQIIPSGGNVDALSERLFEDFTKADLWEVYNEVPNVLKTLRSRGKRLGVISNFDERLDTILENLGLRHYLDFVVTSRECGFEKPDKKIFREAILVSGVGDGTFLHVGDHPINDFEGPKRAGIMALLLTRRPAKVPQNVPTINDLTPLLTMVS